ncbi:hypothetical protein [Phlebiopsis gigantea ambi-like virus 1]|nr:hypothetical protein [Phlebiopsis gigantea ambi-like virus 1]
MARSKLIPGDPIRDCLCYVVLIKPRWGDGYGPFASRTAETVLSLWFSNPRAKDIAEISCSGRRRVCCLLFKQHRTSSAAPNPPVKKQREKRAAVAAPVQWCVLRPSRERVTTSIDCHGDVQEVLSQGLSPFWRDELRNMWTASKRLSQQDKKATVTLARAQHIPFIGEKTHLATITRLATCSPDHQCHIEWHSFLIDYGSYICSPLHSSMVIDIMRCAPLSPRDIAKSKTASFAKEISVMEASPLPSRFNYEVWFNPSQHSSAFMAGLPPNPAMASVVHSTLVQWVAYMTSRVHYPRLSKKKVALGMTREWSTMEGREWNEETQGIFDQRVGERYLHDTGHMLESPAEIRQKWYHSGLTPRSYYAMGGTAFHRSKHLQDGFGVLVDLLQSTNHTSRLNPTRIMMDEDEYLLIWDLWCFTSNHHEQRHFLNRLSEWCSGILIEVMDAEDGFAARDLGMMISVYNQLNDNPEYSMERVDGRYQDLVLCHHTAGFLGVYGNLMTCTFVHGCSVLMVLSDPSRLNVAGDDGHAPYSSREEKDKIISVIRANGVVEESKLYTTEEDGCVCLKRGLVQIGGRLLQKQLYVLPSLAVILEYLDRLPPQFAPSGKSHLDLRSSVATECLRFLSSLVPNVFSEDEEAFVLEYLRAIWVICSLPEMGCVPQYGGDYLCPVLPANPRELYRDHLRYVLGLFYPGIAVVPKRRYDLPTNDGSPSSSWTWQLGFEHETPSDRYLNYMEVLGYVETESVDIVVSGDPGLRRFIREFEEFSPRIYLYRCIDIPATRFRRPTDH